MTTLLSTFPVQQPLQFVPYNGPPKRGLPTKKALSRDDDVMWDGEELAHAAHSVEVVDLTCSADNEADYKISGSGTESNNFGSRWNRSHLIANSRIDGASDNKTSDDGDRANGDNRSGVADHNDDWPLPHRERSVNYEQNGYAGEIPFGTLKSPNEDYTAERSSQDITFSIKDHQMHPMADGGEGGECLSRRADSSAQNTTGGLTPRLDRSEVIDLGDESSDDDEGERGRKFSLLRSRSSSVLHAIQHSMVEPQQPPRSEPASDQGEHSPLRSVSNGGVQHYHSDHNGEDSRDREMSSLWLVQKRKRDASVTAIGRKRHSSASSKRSKAAHAPKQRTRYLSHCPPRPTSKVLARAYAEVRCSEDTSAESSSDGAGNDKNNCYINSKELQSTDKLVLNRGSTSDDTEYEVERILAVCLR